MFRDDHAPPPTDADFCGDAGPIATDPYRDDVISSRQQSVLNDLRADSCRDDFAYLNRHPEVKAIATLLLREMFRTKPDDPYAHAARFLSDPRTAGRVAQFVRSSEDEKDAPPPPPPPPPLRRNTDVVVVSAAAESSDDTSAVFGSPSSSVDGRCDDSDESPSSASAIASL